MDLGAPIEKDTLGSGDTEQKEFYDYDSTKITLKEYRYGTPLFLMPLVVLLKLLKVKLPGSTDDPPVRTIAPFEVDSLDEEETARLKPLADQLEALGFVDPVYHRIDDPFHATNILWATYRNSEGAFARVHSRIWSYGSKTKSYLFPLFVSEISGERFVVSTSGSPDMLPPPSWKVNRIIGLGVDQLWESHKDAVSRESFETIPINTKNDLREVIEKHHASARDFHLARQVFHDLNADQKERLDHAAAECDMSLDDAAVIAEVRKQENKRSGWLSLLIIAVVSLAMFMGMGLNAHPTRFLLILVGVLAFHEAGHFIVMKLLGYRNMKMFFIPLVGAAVSGRKYNVPGWKRCLVSLSGPLPGIILGLPIGVAALILNNSILKELALLLLVLNGLNLLPVMPLDGGRLVHALLFCRHPLLDIVFRIFAIIVLLGMGLALQDRITLFIGVAFAISIPYAYKTAKIASKLRAQNLVIPAGCDTNVPTSIALKIIEELRHAFPKGLNLRNRAQLTSQIYETINARPTKLWSTIIFSAIYCGTFVFVSFFLIIFVILSHGSFSDLFDHAATRPQYVYNPQNVASWSGKRYEFLGRSSVVCLSTFRDALPKANELFNKIKSMNQPDSRLLTLGNAVFWEFPFKNEKDLDKKISELGDDKHDVLVGRGKFPLSLTVFCIAKSESKAREISDELDSYFAFSNIRPLTPPWSRYLKKDVARARRTYTYLTSPSTVPTPDPEREALQTQMSDAIKRGDSATLDTLATKIQKQDQLALKKKIDEARNNDKWNQEVVELYQKWRSALSNDEESAYKEAERIFEKIADKMGLEEGISGEFKDQVRSVRVGSTGGWSTRKGLLLECYFFSLNSPIDSIPAILSWIVRNDCADIHYSIQRYTEDEEYY